jgi:hypothetical protein
MKTDKPKRNKAIRVAIANPPTAEQVVVRQSADRECGQPAPTEPIHHLTELAAKVDVGWGNALFLRGEGNGLSWEKGLPLVCTDNSTWSWTTLSAKANTVCKLLLNDKVWSCGPDLVLEPGKRLVVVPAF